MATRCPSCDGKVRKNTGRRAWVMSQHPGEPPKMGTVCARCFGRAVALVCPPPTTLAPPCAECHRAAAAFCRGCYERLAQNVRALSGVNAALAAGATGAEVPRFMLQELEQLVAEHDALIGIVERARDGNPGEPPDVPSLHLVTPARLDAYLQAGGWAIDEAGSDEKRRTWRKASRVCYTHAAGDTEVMAWDLESVALGEECSALRVLVGLLGDP